MAAEMKCLSVLWGHGAVGEKTEGVRVAETRNCASSSRSVSAWPAARFGVMEGNWRMPSRQRQSGGGDRLQQASSRSEDGGSGGLRYVPLRRSEV
jgi:hypothetical protein